MDVLGRNILIVEDETIVALEMARHLRGMGVQVVGPVDTGEEALERTLSGDIPVHAILMDVRLQGPMDGIDTAARLRELACDVPVVFLTGLSDAHTLDRIAEVEPYGYLLKPFDERALWVTLHTALRRHEQEQARALEAQQRQLSDARYRAILDHSHDGILSIDAEQQVVVFNRGAEGMFGIPAKRAVGRPLSDFLPAFGGAQQPFIDALLAGKVATRPTTLREMEGRRKGGEAFPAEVSVSRLSMDGEVLVTAIVRDLSDRKRLEAQFHHSQKLETMGRLASSVAHDFNNQLVPIGGYAELLCRTLPEDDARRGDAMEIRAATRRAARLTRQLLMAARRDVPQPVPLAVDGLVAELSDMMRRLIGSDIELEIDLQAEGARVLMDPSCLEQIVLNLVVNARDAMQYGGRIALATRVLEGDEVEGLRKGSSESWLQLSVSDSGPGIPVELRPRVFEPFFTTKPVGVGTGLGLSTVQSIVQQARGQVSLQSEPGAGATFLVHVPLRERVSTAPGRDAAGDVPKVVLRDRVRILVVDDDEDVCRFTGRVLHEAGYDVHMAGSPTEALKACTSPRHLLITDLVLPTMSGAELASRVVAKVGCAVLYTTGYADEDLQGRGLSLSGSSLLRKPYGAQDLEAAVREQLLRGGLAVVMKA